MLDKFLPSPLNIAKSLPKQKWISEGITNVAAVGKRQRLHLLLPLLGPCQWATSISIMFKVPCIYFQVFYSPELSMGGTCNSAILAPLWPLRSSSSSCSATPVGSHKLTSKACKVLSFPQPHVSLAQSLAPTLVSRRCQFINMSGLIQFTLINSLDEYIVSLR